MSLVHYVDLIIPPILGRLSFDGSEEKTVESYHFLPISPFNQTPLPPIFSPILHATFSFFP